MTRSLALVVVLVPLLGCGDSSVELAEVGPTPEPHVQGATRETRDEDAKPGYLGVVVPRGQAEVLAPFTSAVISLDVKLGDHVTQGQRLARLDERPLREELAIAKALLKASQAAAAQADVERRGAVVAYEREKRAFQSGVASQAEVTTAEVNQRRAEMNVARAAANVEEHRARIAQLTARLGDTTLVSPIEGRVALLYRRPGDRVEEGHAVIRVISSDELFVKFAIPAGDAGSLAPGDPVDIMIVQQRVTTPGIVRHVAPEIDPVAQMILADADLTPAPPKLQSGSECRIIPRAKK